MIYEKYVIVNMRVQETFNDWPDNKSNAIILFFAGCEHNCPECHNYKIADRKNLNIDDSWMVIKFDKNNKQNIISLADSLKKKCEEFKTNKIIFEGGDPLATYNREFVSLLTQEFSQSYSLCIYTGYDIDEVKKMPFMFNVEFIKTGRYIKELAVENSDIGTTLGKNDKYLQLATTNQQMWRVVNNFATNKTEYVLFSNKNGTIYFNN